MNNTITLTPEEAYWIERSADIESSLLMERFIKLANLPIEKLNEEEKKLFHESVKELIDAQIMLRELRMKLEINRKNQAPSFQSSEVVKPHVTESSSGEPHNPKTKITGETGERKDAAKGQERSESVTKSTSAPGRSPGFLEGQRDTGKVEALFLQVALPRISNPSPDQKPQRLSAKNAGITYQPMN